MNILIHSLVNLGDVVLSTGAAALIKENIPNAKITMMVRPIAREIVENNPVVDDFIIFDYKVKGKSLKQMLTMIKTIKAKKFDVCFSFDRKLRPALVCFFARIPQRVCAERIFDYKSSNISLLYNNMIKMPEDFINNHQADLFQEIIRKYFNITGFTKPVIGKITREHDYYASKLVANMKKDKKIALCIKGTYYSKNWPIEKFIELINKINNEFNVDFSIVGAKEDFEYAEDLISKTNIEIVNLCGKTSLLQYAALMKKINLLVTIDTGGMHVAATTNVPIVAIYRCVSTNRWRALSDKIIAISSNLDDCNVSKFTNPEECPGYYCVKDIKTADVYSAILSYLKEKDIKE